MRNFPRYVQFTPTTDVRRHPTHPPQPPFHDASTGGSWSIDADDSLSFSDIDDGFVHDIVHVTIRDNVGAAAAAPIVPPSTSSLTTSSDRSEPRPRAALLPAVLFANRCLVESYERRCHGTTNAAGAGAGRSHPPCDPGMPSSSVSRSSVSYRSVVSALHESLPRCGVVEAASSSGVRGCDPSFETARQWGDELLEEVSEASSLSTLRMMKIELYRKRLYYMKLDTIRKRERKIRSERESNRVVDTAKRLRCGDRTYKDTGLNTTVKEHGGGEREEVQRPRKYRTSKWIQDTIKWRAERQRRLSTIPSANNLVNT